MERLRRLMRHNDAGIALSAGLLFVGCALSSESFLSAYNLFNISRIVAFSVLVALAQALVLVAGGMNLSVGAIGGLATITTGYCIQVLGLPGWLAALVALGIGGSGWVGQRGHHHAVADQFLYRHAGHAFCLYRASAWVFRRLRLHGHSSGIHVFGTAEVFGAVEFVLDDGAGTAGDALRIPAHGVRAAAVGDRGESGGGPAGGDQYRSDDFAVARAVGRCGGAGRGVVGLADGFGATGDG